MQPKLTLFNTRPTSLQHNTRSRSIGIHGPFLADDEDVFVVAAGPDDVFSWLDFDEELS